MAEFVDGGAFMFNALAYGKPHPGTQNFVARQFEMMSPTLQAASGDFVARARDMWERLASHDAVRMMRAAGRAIRAAWQVDEIRPLFTMPELQHAPLAMRRWIMAEPTTRKLYHQQRIDGYSDTYVDAEPGMIGEAHTDYRLVMSGMVIDDQVPNKQGEYGWHATTWLDELAEDESEFTLEEQVDIFNTWDTIKAYMKAGREDATSRFAVNMG